MKEKYNDNQPKSRQRVIMEWQNVLIHLVWMEMEIVGDYGDYVRFQ